LAKGFAVASEEADKRSWRTLPDEIHLARTWVSPGVYRLQKAPATGVATSNKTISVRAGESAVVIQRVIQ
jgi:uncharacterized protein